MKSLLTTAVALSLVAQPIRQRPEIIRTDHGVPHVFAANLWAAGYGLAWVELEDYGGRVVSALVSARGEMGIVYGRDSIEQDFVRRPIHAHARRVWPRLEAATRQMYEGFAMAVNDYVRAHRPEFAPAIGPAFVGWDVLAREIAAPDLSGARRIINRREPPRPAPGRDDGSNAWALAPSRTRSGRAILLRNPHLDWDAGYYEAHLIVPGVLDFYGDFRIGGAFAVVGGFNRDLGWATTNNAVDTDELYAVPLARGRTDQILLDGQPVPLTKDVVAVPYRTATGRSVERREYWRSPLGPIVEKRNGIGYLLMTANEGEFRGGEQFLKMMRARSFADWETAMKIRARATSNLTYADRAGNIFYVWNGALPALPHAPGGDSMAIPVRRRRDMFSRLVPWDSLPMVKNPATGYLHNENDSPHWANFEAPLDSARFPANVERPSLGLRSQHSLDLIRHPADTLALDDILLLKHSYRMLLAERVLPDLLAEASRRPAAPAAAVAVLRRWDQSVAPNARGGVLFEMWWRLYQAKVRPPFAQAWTASDPMTTPRGLADPEQAIAALALAADSVTKRFGRLDVAWGEAHRIRIGSQDIPVGGCRGDLGCFRVLWYADEPDGKRRVQGGDGWILAVEFDSIPKAYSVLGYGQSNRPDSPLLGDQAVRFAAGNLKTVAYTKADIERGAVRRYRAGPANQSR